MITLYGIDGRSFRCAWALEEIGLTYKRIPLKFSQDTKTPEFLKLNPNGKIPALRDKDLVIFESLAINIHLAKNHSTELWPSNPADQSLVIQWMAWAMGELEGPHDAANRSKTKIDNERFDRSLHALRTALEGRSYLLGDKFSIADLNTTALLMRPQYSRIARRDPSIGHWYESCTHREALTRALAEDRPD